MGVLIPAELREAVVRHAQWCLPQEACGLLAGDATGAIRMAYPLTNSVASKTRFTIEPAEHFGALRHAENQGWELAGVFHSHPTGPASPSATDIREAADPDWLYVVVGLADRDMPQVRGFRITAGVAREVELL